MQYLGNHMSVVSLHLHFFDTMLTQNIMYETQWHAAHMRDFIACLPHGYEMRLCENAARRRGVGRAGAAGPNPGA